VSKQQKVSCQVIIIIIIITGLPNSYTTSKKPSIPISCHAANHNSKIHKATHVHLFLMQQQITTTNQQRVHEK
jgi:hypothetical protein